MTYAKNCGPLPLANSGLDVKIEVLISRIRALITLGSEENGVGDDDEEDPDGPAPFLGPLVPLFIHGSIVVGVWSRIMSRVSKS
jgi:hypothetical protein